MVARLSDIEMPGLLQSFMTCPAQEEMRGGDNDGLLHAIADWPSERREVVVSHTHLFPSKATLRPRFSATVAY